jgi:hypothetical protein
MGLLAQMRKLAAGPRRRLLDDLAACRADELRMVLQLRTHAQSVPYPSLTQSLVALADQHDAHALLLQGEIERLGGTVGRPTSFTARAGRNYWERLTFDLDDLRLKSKQYIELGQHWDIEYPEAAAVFSRLARETGTMGRAVRDLIARSDPHAVN